MVKGLLKEIPHARWMMRLCWLTLLRRRRCHFDRNDGRRHGQRPPQPIVIRAKGCGVAGITGVVEKRRDAPKAGAASAPATSARTPATASGTSSATTPTTSTTPRRRATEKRIAIGWARLHKERVATGRAAPNMVYVAPRRRARSKEAKGIYQACGIIQRIGIEVQRLRIQDVSCQWVRREPAALVGSVHAERRRVEGCFRVALAEGSEALVSQ